ncbi:MAG: hypothetical protein OEL86_01000 [Sulfuritalea sp.]|nr:hypothetical protein [Sulfuritalea sp.]
MRHLLRLLAALFCAYASPHLHASQEGALLVSEFAVSSPGIGSSGPVRVSGTQRSEGIVSLRVQAFGREYVLPAALVAELQGFHANGLLFSYESGYKETGGRTVYLGFVRGFTTGVQASKHVSVSESGEFKLLKSAGQ